MESAMIMNTRLLWKVIFIASLLTLNACAEEETGTTPTANHSTRLLDNPLPDETEFANFENKNISIDPSALPLAGNRIFLKLSRVSGELLFLGEIGRFRIFNLQVDLLLDDETLHYEIFSDDSNDETQTGVINL